MPCSTLRSDAAWRCVPGPATPIDCSGRSLGPFCVLGAALPARGRRRRRPCAAPKIARSRCKYIKLQYSQSFCTTCRPAEEFSIHKFGINMVLIGDLWSRARPTASPPAQWQSGSEDAEGPEAAPWTGERRRWAEDTTLGGSGGQRPAGHGSIQKWYETAGWGARVWVYGRVCTAVRYGIVVSVSIIGWCPL